MFPVNMPFKSPFTSSTTPASSSSQQPTASTSTQPPKPRSYSHAHAHGLMERKLSLLLSGCDGGTHDFDRGDEQGHMAAGGYAWDAGYESEGGMNGWAARRSSSESALQTSPSSTPSTSPSSSASHLSSRPNPTPLPQSTKTSPNLSSSGLAQKLDSAGPSSVLVEMRRKNKTIAAGHFDPSRDARLLAI